MARLASTPSYRSWQGAKDRCFNPKNKMWSRYGGRGITMCEEWRNSYDAFMKHIGPRPNGLTLDRIDSNGHYEPGNVRWASRKIQSINRHTTRWTEVDYEKMRNLYRTGLWTQKQIAAKFGIKQGALSKYLKGIKRPPLIHDGRRNMRGPRE